MAKTRKEYVIARDRVKVSAGDVIKEMCELNELTQAELAKRSGLQESNLSLIIRGKRSIGKAVAEKIAKVLNVSAAFILFAGETPRKGAELYGGVDTMLIEKAMQKIEENKNKNTHIQLNTLRTAIEFIAKAILSFPHAEFAPLHAVKHAKHHR